GITNPPVYWDDLINMVPLLTKKDATNSVTKSAVAMGQFVNVAHAKEIISALFMQAGNPIVSEKEGFFVSSLDQTVGKYDLASVLQFYTDFADPVKNVYSWNRSFSNSSDAFSAENLAFYFGYASELQNLVNKNPNQNFMVAPLPQIKNANFKLTSGRVTGIAISAFSKNLTTAITAAGLMSSGDFAAKLSGTLGVTPARRDLLAVKKVDAYNTTFYPSALYARSWMDPSSDDTNNIFKGMVDGVLSNNLTADNAIRDASSKLDLLLLK
ncbi:MAG: extracellular solute-binding protein, partial [Candidatus Pacebacteria bacterium]|nr:extracellular solute-binding protein [Candidatus Paceibacterota bacterium]